MDDSLDAVVSFFERASLRIQAGDLLTNCLEEGNVAPMHGLVEGLVVAGPQSLRAIREILAEVIARKSQLEDDLFQVHTKIDNDLLSRSLVNRIEGHLRLLDEIEIYAEDWLGGLVYQSIRRVEPLAITPPEEPMWLH